MITNISPRDEIISLLYRPTAGFEIPNHLRQTLLEMVRNEEIKEAGLLSVDYARVIFYKSR